MKKQLGLLSLALLLSAAGISQSRSTLEDEGYDYLNNAEYAKAYAVFDKLHSRYPKEIDYQFKLGICALNYTEKKERAIEIFQEMKVKYNTAETETYLGKAYHRNYRFDEAIVILQPLLEKLSISKKKEDKDLIPDIELTLNNCHNGKVLMQEKVFADIQNIGPPINTTELEGVPVITADEATMIYTYVGRKSLGGKLNAEMKYDPKGMYLSDIYITSKDATGNWLPGKPVEALNTKGNDAAIAISPDGSTLFTFLSNNENEGDIMVSRLTGDEFSVPEPLNSNINTPEYWEGSCSISADGKLLYFSSERPDGLGGRDIYVSELVNGDWGPAVNLGPAINTKYDDDAPFIHPDGVTLFFSSKGHSSIGGYDIMFSTKDQYGEWGTPQNMGIPLNTTEDDSYYVLNSKGDKGYFSSTRTGSGGYGSQDIYVVTPGMKGEKPVLAMLKGTIYGDDKPVEGIVEVSKKDGIVVANYNSNNNTGKYLATLRPGEEYRIKVSAPGFAPVQEDLDLVNLDTYLEQNKDFFLYSQSFAGTPKQTEEKKPEEEIAAVTPKEEEPVAEEPPAEKIVSTPVAEPEEEEEEIAALTPKEEPEPQQQSYTSTESPAEPATNSVAKTTRKAEPCSDNLPDLSAIKGKSLNDPAIYKQLLDGAGNYCADRLVFTVQVGAFKNPENFKYKKLTSMGEVLSKAYPDGVTRFTQNEYTTLNLAEKQRQRVITKGVKDAWIVAFVDGQRYTLEDFIMLDFMGGPLN